MYLYKCVFRCACTHTCTCICACVPRLHFMDNSSCLVVMGTTVLKMLNWIPLHVGQKNQKGERELNNNRHIWGPRAEAENHGLGRTGQAQTSQKYVLLMGPLGLAQGLSLASSHPPPDPSQFHALQPPSFLPWPLLFSSSPFRPLGLFVFGQSISAIIRHLRCTGQKA